MMTVRIFNLLVFFVALLMVLPSASSLRLHVTGENSNLVTRLTYVTNVLLKKFKKKTEVQPAREESEDEDFFFSLLRKLETNYGLKDVYPNDCCDNIFYKFFENSVSLKEGGVKMEDSGESGRGSKKFAEVSFTLKNMKEMKNKLSLREWFARLFQLRDKSQLAILSIQDDQARAETTIRFPLRQSRFNLLIDNPNLGENEENDDSLVDDLIQNIQSSSSSSSRNQGGSSNDGGSMEWWVILLIVVGAVLLLLVSSAVGIFLFTNRDLVACCTTSNSNCDESIQEYERAELLKKNQNQDKSYLRNYSSGRKTSQSSDLQFHDDSDLVKNIINPQLVRCEESLGRATTTPNIYRENSSSSSGFDLQMKWEEEEEEEHNNFITPSISMECNKMKHHRSDPHPAPQRVGTTTQEKKVRW